MLVRSSAPSSTAARPTAAGTSPAFDGAVRWLRSSGIQTADGGYRAWYDREAAAYPFVYAEVTGYQVTLSAWLHAITGDAAHLAAGAATVGWLLGRAQDADGAFRCLVPDGSAPLAMAKTDRRYAFDAGIILQGLVAHHRTTGDPLAVDAARAAADWLLREQRPDGFFTPFLASTPWRDVAADWSTRPGTYQAKVAIGLAALGELLGERRYLVAAAAAVEAAAAAQEASGRFVTNPVANSTNPHPHCYTAEAMWAVGMGLEREEWVTAAAAAAGWLADATGEGDVPRRWAPGAEPVRHVRVDSLAQLLRLVLLTDAGGPGTADVLARRLLSFQDRSGDERADGGVGFGYASDGRALPHVNVWVTGFAVQALGLLAMPAGARSLDWRLLV